MSWAPIHLAPIGSWVEVGDGKHSMAAISDHESGWWEDETGDFHVEAAQNKGAGLTQWRPLATGYRVQDLGTDRSSDPVYVQVNARSA